MINGRNSDSTRNQRGKKFMKGWRQAFYFPFGQDSTEKIYMPGNLDEEISLWLGEHLQHERDRAKADFVFLSGLKEILEDLFVKQEPFYTSPNGVVMAIRDQRQLNSPAKIMFQVPGSRPQEYELPRWKIVEAIRVMEGLDKIRNGASADTIEKPAQEIPAKTPVAPEPLATVLGGTAEKSIEPQTPGAAEIIEEGTEAGIPQEVFPEAGGKENSAPEEQNS